jgi:HEAT repeat protein
MVLALAMVLVLGCGYFVWANAPEIYGGPYYHGRSWSYWSSAACGHDPNGRRQAIRVFGEALSDSRVAVRTQVVKRLAYDHGMMLYASAEMPEAIPGLIHCHQHDDYAYNRGSAAIALGEIHAQPDIVVPALMDAQADPENFVRDSARTALAKFGLR